MLKLSIRGFLEGGLEWIVFSNFDAYLNVNIAKLERWGGI